ncbi:hypothetical protein C7M84_005103 [Penaeus vannamei]|uniref:Uncharacterized protein n=1 Tax=Penaeus vannamei TaxID=6689 RepID=A0A3R7M917_PENVA|nr:hypothetical protein C7M84_005103 [Penaeus vannamei]
MTQSPVLRPFSLSIKKYTGLVVTPLSLSPPPCLSPGHPHPPPPPLPLPQLFPSSSPSPASLPHLPPSTLVTASLHNLSVLRVSRPPAPRLLSLSLPSFILVPRPRLLLFGSIWCDARDHKGHQHLQPKRIFDRRADQ